MLPAGQHPGDDVEMDEDMTTVTVALQGGADFSCIGDALRAAPADSPSVFRIIVAGGFYEVGLLEMKPNVHIIAADGCSPTSENPVIIAAQDDHPSVCSRVMGAVLRDIRIEHPGPFGSMASVVIEAGNLRLENCVLTGSVTIAVLMCGTAAPVLDGCEVYLCSGDGIKVLTPPLRPQQDCKH